MYELSMPLDDVLRDFLDWCAAFDNEKEDMICCHMMGRRSKGKDCNQTLIKVFENLKNNRNIII